MHWIGPESAAGKWSMLAAGRTPLELITVPAQKGGRLGGPPGPMPGAAASAWTWEARGPEALGKRTPPWDQQQSRLLHKKVLSGTRHLGSEWIKSLDMNELGRKLGTFLGLWSEQRETLSAVSPDDGFWSWKPQRVRVPLLGGQQAAGRQCHWP